MSTKKDFDLPLKQDVFGAVLHDAINRYGSANMELVQDAFSMSKMHHGNQTRRSGEPFYSHPVEVACLVCKFQCATNLICAALLHDTVEDTKTNIDMINFAIGREVGTIVDAVTNLDVSQHVKLSSFINTHKMQQMEDAMLLKLCDRLHNTRTMKHLKAAKVEKKVKENLVTFIPAARARGYEELARELKKESEKLIQDLNLFSSS